MITCLDVENTFNDDGGTNILTGTKAINQGLKDILLTMRNELLGDPNFGSILREKSFNLMNDVLKDIICDHIISQINTYDKRIVVNDIILKYLNQHTLDITINYSYQSEVSSLNLWIMSEV